MAISPLRVSLLLSTVAVTPLRYCLLYAIRGDFIVIFSFPASLTVRSSDVLSAMYPPGMANDIRFIELWNLKCRLYELPLQLLALSLNRAGNSFWSVSSRRSDMNLPTDAVPLYEPSAKSDFKRIPHLSSLVCEMRLMFPILCLPCLFSKVIPPRSIFPRRSPWRVWVKLALV